MTEQQQALLHYTAPLTGENELDNVPLNMTATTGVLPVDVETTVLKCKLSPQHPSPLLCAVTLKWDILTIETSGKPLCQ